MTILTATMAGGYTLGIVGMNELWYKDFQKSSFHFFNDNKEWKQVDKSGHFYSAFYLSHLASRSYQWAGANSTSSYIYGSLTGFLLMTPIEVLDGFSEGYGASWGDLIANSNGSFLYGGQMLLWKEIRIKPKFSYHATSFAPLRPNTLGDGMTEILKDYNGQTYWLSFHIYDFLKEESRFPKWLAISAGYGAHNMVYADDAINELNGLYPVRQYYLSPDIDFTKIKTKRKIIKSLLYFADAIHIPAPALEYNRRQGLKWHWIYF